MYNGIGLTTPRGSGTNGYVVRNLSALRPHEKDRNANNWDVAPPKHREPDQAILEHERKRGVEVKCLELQLELEDEGLEADEIEKKVDELRQKLMRQLHSFAPSAKNLRASDTHAIAAAKKTELSRMARALGTRMDYVEGEAFDREKQEEIKAKRAVEREERDRQREDARAKMLEQKEKWEAEKKEKDRLRRREEDRMRREGVPTGPRNRDGIGYGGPPARRRDYSASPRRRDSSPRRRSPSRGRSMSVDSRSPSPRRRSMDSRSPPPRRAVSSRSRSPPRKRRDSRSPPRRIVASASPPPKRRSPPARRRSPSPRGRKRSRSAGSGSSISRSP
ncbi:hypothetical protein DL96DRAFT_1593913 [Flagelloscypha sp. PMI_526]|nr:hypothetical protein DL96DRAFT_1593913 [Flagelloscypha sp. PMI_526]